jgi:glycosyltransferase involved in cell wall biosynthesis
VHRAGQGAATNVARLRILHVGKFYPPFAGGMERFLKDLMVAQHEQGSHVAALVHHHGRGQDTTDEWDDGILVRRVRSFGQIIYAPVSPSFPAHLSDMVKAFEPDILHLHLPNTSAFWTLAVTTDIPSVIQWQSDVLPSKIDPGLRLAYRFYRPWEQALLRRAAAIIVASEPYLRESSALRPHRSKCRVLTLGIEPSDLMPPDPAKVESIRRRFGGRPLILFVGRLAYYKGVDVLLQAMVAVRNAELVVVGTGQERDRLIQSAAELGIRDRVHFLGYVEDHELPDWFSACRVFCLPSIERTEAFGMVLLEAMGYGRPLVTTRIMGSGVNWVNLEGETGLVVTPGDSRELAQALNKLLADEQLATNMGSAGRDRLDKHFQIHSIAEKMNAIYGGSLISSRTVRSPR